MLDFSKYPVVDSHCHPFLPDKETEPFETYLKLSGLQIPRTDIVSTLQYRQVMRELSRVLGVKGADEEVIEERMRRYRKDPIEYTRFLFDNACIETMLVDTGYPAVENVGYSIRPSEFSKIVPSEVKEIVRIEIILYNLIKNQVAFDDAVEQFHEQVRSRVSNGAVALKSIVAYRTGLEVVRKSEGEVKRAYQSVASEVKEGKSVKEVLSSKTENVKAVYDHFVLLGVEDSVRLGVPIQMHTGIGDAPMDLRISNPLLLNDLINDPSAKDAKIILTHGGYPYIEEAGFLVNSYPNVFLDLSETIPFTTIGAKEKFLNLLEMAPTTKIMYGSDGFNIPELYWLASIRAKRSLAYALSTLVESDEIDEEGAERIARLFLSENAKRIYNL